MTSMRIPCLLLLVLLVIPCLAEATTYYVDKSGSDSNSCATASGAASNRSLAKLTMGNSNGSGGMGCPSAGDTLIVGNGTYVEAEMYMNRSGTSGSHIVIKSENHLGAIISSISSANPNFSLYGNYVDIEDFDLRIDASNVYYPPNSAAGTGVRCWNGNCTVRRIKTDNPTSGGSVVRSHSVKTNFSSQAGHSLVEYSELGAGLELIGDNDVGRFNHITGGGNWGNGVTVKAGSHNILLYGNLIDGSLTSLFDAGLILGGVTNNSPAQECYYCAAWNNVIITPTGKDGMAFWGAGNSVFFNNILVNGNLITRNGYTSTPVNNSWKNNIVLCNGADVNGGIAATNTVDYNLFYNCTDVPSQTHAITGNPNVVSYHGTNAALGDWHLNTGSPALNVGATLTFTDFNGTSVAVHLDYDGATRTVPWDLGIYEMSGGAATGTVMVGGTATLSGVKIQ